MYHITQQEDVHRDGRLSTWHTLTVSGYGWWVVTLSEHSGICSRRATRQSLCMVTAFPGGI